ncbi:MAG TPA: ABC transporter substrate-binding protein [Solirubrobacterales bacterium]
MRICCLIALLVLGALAVLLAGCGDDSPGADAGAANVDLSRTMGVTLDGRVGPANAPIRLAEEKGYFEDLGLDAWAGSPQGPEKPTLYVSTRTNAFGVTQLPQLLIARDKGAPLVAIGSLVPEATAAMIWLEGSRIRSIADLKGKTIAIPGVAFQKPMLESVLRQAGLTLADVEIKRVGYELVSVLMKGRADAIFGGSWNVEGAALEADGAEPVIEPVGTLGVPAYDELVLIARRDFVESEPELARAFVDGIRRGVETELRDSAAAVKLIEETIESSPESSRKATEAGVEATLPLLSGPGEVDPQRVEELAAWMRKEGMIRRELPASAVIVDP